MFLKSLHLKGFKSFAEATALELEPGITVVVGPNGSGKSNVVDAIGWVLGAQAPSAVRSQKMDDVIFAGTTRRAALGRAEVALTIDNGSGLLPIDFTEVTLTRTLFRSGDSEYSINGVPCRLLDIQELLSDSGVGRQQHVIISQGQIDAVLNAKPEDRRLVIEEAAGVLKYRRRKERSERRLSATEANLTRLQDLLREVRRQLRPLEKQAHDARRHGDLVAELHRLRVHAAGRDLARLRDRLESAVRQQREHRTEEQRLKAELADLDRQVVLTEARLGAMGGDDLGDALARYESMRERARGLAAVLAERRRGIERDRHAYVDRTVVANLETERARLTGELADVEREASSLESDAQRLADAEASLESQRTSFESQWADDVPVPSGEASEVRGELAALRSGIERTADDHRRVDARLEALHAKVRRLAAEADRLRAELAAAEEVEVPLVGELERAERRRSDAEQALAAAEGTARRADADHHTWQARAEALALALDEARQRAGAERLAQVDGVLGTLLDLVDVEDGWEAAFTAAAGEALSAIVVADERTARRALDTLRSGEVSGAVLALTGWAAPVTAAPVGEPVRRHVGSTRPGVDALLDALIGGVACVDGGWAAAVDAAVAHPGATFVTREGDRFGVSGWRVGSDHAQATGAALEEARGQAAETDAARALAHKLVAEARVAVDSARREEAELTRALDSNDGRLSAAADGLQRIETDRLEGTAELDALVSHRGELEDRIAREQDRRRDLEQRLPLLEAAESASEERARLMTQARTRLEATAAEVGAERSTLGARTAGLEERRRFLAERLAQVTERLDLDVAERATAERRRHELDAREVVTDRLSRFVAARLSVIEVELGDIRERRRLQSEEARAVGAELEALRSGRGSREQRLEQVRELHGRAEVDHAETALRVENAVTHLRSELDCEPEQAMAAPAPELPDGVLAAARLRDLERELRLMGPINPLALQEFEQLQERHQFLQDQLDDVRQTRRELAKVISAIDGEIVNVFAAAYADVAENFEKLFDTLFPGGRGRLRLTDPSDLLGTGIEIEAKPSGKNVRKLSLLSGGERSLTALAYLFAVFRSRPSPFYVLDEVEAALDDVNLHRFLDLVAEFRTSAQLIIVSHQKRTMEAADVLYGVTMEPGGSSRVISEKASSVFN